MRDVLVTSDLNEWSQAVVALQHNEGLAAIYTVADEQVATNAVDYSRAPFGSNGLLLANKLPPEFREALRIAHNASHPKEIENIDEGMEWSAYMRGATGLHVDGYVGVEDESCFPLITNFTCRGVVEVTFVPIACEDIPRYSSGEVSYGLPQSLKRLLVDTPGVECAVDATESKFLPHEKALELGKVAIVRAGQLIAHSGWSDLKTGRLPVAHQFISQGLTAEDRNSRTSSFIRTDYLI